MTDEHEKKTMMKTTTKRRGSEMGERAIRGSAVRWPRHVFARGALLACLSLGAVACKSGASKSSSGLDGLADGDQPTEHLELDPMLVTVGKDGKPGLSVNADEVFQKAYTAYAARRYEDALVHYGTIVEYFPESRFFIPSLFNSGLANEKLERWEQASQSYQRIIDTAPEKSDAKDAYFRLASVYEKLARHADIVELMTQVMLRPDIEHFDRIEAHARRSMALLETEDYVEAEDGFRTLLQLNREADISQRLNESAEYIVQAQFGMGRALHLQVLKIALVLPTEKMGEDLETKANLFLRSQSAYIQALRVHHPQWSVAAGYMIGRLYEDFYLDILSAEIPESLTDEQISLYFEELRKQLRPLMVRAIQVYEKNLSLSKRIAKPGAMNEWADASDIHLQRLKSYLDDPFTQRRAERLVIQGKPLEDLWNPRLMVRDVVDEALDDARREMDDKGSKNNKI